MSSSHAVYAQATGSATPPAPGATTLTASTPAGQAVTPAAAGSPASGTSAAPAANPPVSTEAACKQALTSLGAGDPSAVKSLPIAQQISILQDEATEAVFTCLAIAEGKTSHCDALAKPKKDKCVEQSQFISELKGLPKESIKAQIIYHICLGEGSKADCGKLREAIKTRDAAKCAGLSKPTGPWGSHNCVALATGDAKECAGASDPSVRAECAALATDDPSLCPKDATDCTNLAGNFALIKKNGLAGINDPVVAAALKGKEGCAPLVARLEHTCGGAPAAPSPVPSP